MKRIQLDSSKFKVSKPGFDVSTATVAQTAFDADGFPYAGVLFSGVENSADGTWSSSAVSGWTIGSNGFQNDYQGSTRLYKEILFSQKGITQPLTIAPDVVVMLKRSGSTGDGATPSFSRADKGGTADSDWSGGAVWASTTTTSLLIRIDRNTELTNSMPTNWQVAYVVFQTFKGLPELTPG